MRFTILFAVVVLSIGFMPRSPGPGSRLRWDRVSAGAGRCYRRCRYTRTRNSTTTVTGSAGTGKISLHLVGEMTASGKTATELQKEISSKLAQFIADPTGYRRRERSEQPEGIGAGRKCRNRACTRSRIARRSLMPWHWPAASQRMQNATRLLV